MTQADIDQIHPAGERSKTTHRQGQSKILIADDSATSRQILSTILARQGYKVQVASDGLTALELARVEPPDLLLLDIRLPSLDGYEVCRELKNGPATCDIPVIFISVLDEVADKVKGFELGGVDYITKPFQAEEVLARIKTHLTLHDLQEQLERRNADLQKEIDERKQIQQVLRESERRYRGIIENSYDGVILVDEQGLIVEWNRGMERISGYGRAEVLGQALWDVQFRLEAEVQRTPELYEQLKASTLALLEGGQVPWLNQVMEREMQCADGTPCVLQHTLSTVPTAKGFMALSIVRDVTERKQAEVALQESEEKFRNLSEQSPDMIFINQNGKVVYANQKCTEILGYTREELYSPDFDFRTLIAPEYLDLILEKFRQHMAGQEVTAYEYALITKEGARIESLSSPVLISYQGEPAILGTVADITELKQAEQALQASQQFIQFTLNALASTIAIIDESGIILAVNDAWRQFADENGLAWEDYGVGANYLAIAEAASGESDDGALEAAAGIREVIAGERPEFIQEYSCHSPETKRWFVMRVTRFESRQGARTVISHDDITWRKEVEETQRKRVVELSALHTIAQTMAAVADLSEALQVVAETMTYLFDADVTYITVPTAEVTELRILAKFRRNGPTSSPPTFPVFALNQMPYTSQVLDQGQSLVIPDVQAVSLPASLRTYLEELDLHAFMIIPLQVRGEIIGILAVGAQQSDRTFGADELALAETIAGDIAAAIKNAQLSERARMAAVDAERQRLARELHDSVTQSLYSLTLLANGWGTMAAQERLSQQQLVDSFKQLGEVGQQGLKEMRLLIHQLRPPVLEEVGLIGALQQRLDAVEQRVNIETRLYTQGTDDDIPLEVAVQLFYIASEALNNTLRHARATVVTVNLQIKAGCLRLSIQDNGLGFDPEARSAGLGLTSMKERAQSIGARLKISSAPRQGTTVEITLALEPDDEVNLAE